MSNIELSFENPWLLLLAIPAFAIILLPFLFLPKLRRNTFRKIAPVVIHLVVVTLLILIIAGFTVTENSDSQAVLLLVDLSDSTAPVQTQIEDHAKQLTELIDQETPVGVLVFGASRVYTVTLDDPRGFAVDTVAAEATDIAAALEYAATLLPTDKAGHIILLTDGKETDGDALSTAQFLSSKDIRIDAVWFDTTMQEAAEVQLGSFIAPEGAYVGDTLAFTADVESNTEAQVTLTLYDDSGEILSQEHAISPGSNVFELNAPAETPGNRAYKLVLETETDNITKNNERYAHVKVTGKSSVLLLADTVGHAEPLAQLLSNDYEVVSYTARNAPRTIMALCDYDVVILSNVDYDTLPTGYDKLLETYVGTFGRTLLAVGGSQTFMYGSMEGTVLEEMLPVTFTLEEDSEAESVALMLVLDCSNSMVQRSTYLSVAKQGAIKCVEAMTGNDFVGVISFNSRAYLQSPLLAATDPNKESLVRTISGLTTSRGTYYTEGLVMAHQELLKSDAKIRHIIFLSDGQPSDRGYTEAVQRAAEDGITVSTIGLGYSSDILHTMASYGNGRYYYVSNASELPNIMLSETEQVTVSSLINGEFLPIVAKESPLTEGISSLPMLYGYLGMTLKEEATAYITTDKGHPIYAGWNYGLGTVVCFTSDLNGSWSSQWLSEAAGAAVTNRMISTSIPAIHHDSSMQAAITVRGQTTDITVTTADGDDHTLNLVTSFGTVTNSYVMTQTEPGVYTTSIETAKPGLYAMMVTQSDKEGTIADYLESAIAVSYSQEYDAFADDGQVLLTTLCGYSGGALFTDMHKLAQVQVGTIRAIFNPMTLFGVLALLLMLIDIAIRKLRWKDIRNYFISHK
ncbi:MAG: VWA domain-containing protein [Oscillospiraceae bacterium]|nr:VWA domain-containing protein [Oscillospiraceae bacterium]